MMEFDTYLFDWDGTTGNTLSVWLKAYRLAFEAMGVAVSDEQVVDIFGVWRGPQRYGVEELEKFEEELARYARLESEKIELHEGAGEVLGRLRGEGKRIAMVTTSWKRLIVPVLERNGLEDVFEVIVDGGDVVQHKPDPEPVLLALKKLNVEPSKRVVMMGDSQNDVEAGKAAGVSTIIFEPEMNRKLYGDRFVNVEADYCIGSWRELWSE
jgi:pyrophosphatase PpaX